MRLPPPPLPEDAVGSQPQWVPSAAPSVSRRGPSRAWYWLAAALATAGVALASWGLWTGIAGFAAIADFPRVDVPGQAEVALDAGSYTVYYEAPGVAGNDQWDDDDFAQDSQPGGASLPALDISMEPVGGAEPVTLAPRLTSSTYRVDGPFGPHEGRSMWQFQLDRAGSYLVTVSAEDHTGPPAAVAIGPGLGRGLVGMVLALFVSFGLVLAAGLIAGITALMRHSRARAPQPSHPEPTQPH